MDKLIYFLNSTFFQTFAMLIVGLLTFLVYKRQKSDEIKNAAAIVKLEIDNIEKSLDRFKLTVVSEEIYKSAPLYQTLEWFKVRNLLINRLAPEIFDAINKFYETVITCEDARNKMKEAVHLNRIDKINAIQNKIQEILLRTIFENPCDTNNQILEECDRLAQKYMYLYNTTSYDFIMNSAIQHYENSLRLASKISNTPAYEKLKDIIQKG